MAIFHLSANVISRARGQSVVAAAAYRSGTKLRDVRYASWHDYTGKRGSEYSEIMAPEGAPDWVRDRETLWNRVELVELRKDSQLARAIELGLPVELLPEQCLALLRDYLSRTFVSKGMVADFCIRRDNPDNPLAQILLTLREVTRSGFGPKARQWNGKANLLEWRAAWAERANEHLARAGHAVRIDHRTLEAQQIELTPARRVGLNKSRGEASLPDHLAARIAEQRKIARENGEAILDDPSIVLQALAHRSPTFTQEDIARFLRSRTDEAQFGAAYRAVIGFEGLVALPLDPAGRARFTSRDMVDAAKSLRQRVVSMATRRGHGVAPHLLADALSSVGVDDQRTVDYLLGEGDAKALLLAAMPDSTPVLTVARAAWDRDGLRLYRIASRTLVSYQDEWSQGRDVPTRASVLMVNGAEMISLKPLERLVAIADKARAKIVLIGDSEQWRAMNFDSPLQDVLREIGLPTG